MVVFLKVEVFWVLFQGPEWGTEADVYSVRRNGQEDPPGHRSRTIPFIYTPNGYTDILMYNVFTDFPCGLPGGADPRIRTTHPYLFLTPEARG